MRPDKDVPFIPAREAVALPLGDPKRLVELVKLDPTIKLDMRYATKNNFTGRVLYTEARAFLTVAAAQAAPDCNAIWRQKASVVYQTSGGISTLPAGRIIR